MFQVKIGDFRSVEMIPLVLDWLFHRENTVRLTGLAWHSEDVDFGYLEPWSNGEFFPFSFIFWIFVSGRRILGKCC